MTPQHDEEEIVEQQAHFCKEEKIILNNLKLNMFMQFMQLVVSVIAALLFDWTHIRASSTITFESKTA